MTTYTLLLDMRVKLIGPGIVAGVAGLIVFSRIAWPWQVVAILAVLLWGARLWWLFLKQRPVSLRFETGGALSCTRADGRTFDVIRVLPGIIHPGLLCARLEAGTREHCDLFVPAGTLTEAEHRQLRRALLGFRQGQSDELRGT